MEVLLWLWHKKPEISKMEPWQAETWTKTRGLPLLFKFAPQPSFLEVWPEGPLKNVNIRGPCKNNDLIQQYPHFRGPPNSRTCTTDALIFQDPEKAGLWANVHLEPRSKSSRTLVLRVLGRPREPLEFLPPNLIGLGSRVSWNSRSKLLEIFFLFALARLAFFYCMCPYVQYLAVFGASTGPFNLDDLHP